VWGGSSIHGSSREFYKNRADPCFVFGRCIFTIKPYDSVLAFDDSSNILEFSNVNFQVSTLFKGKQMAEVLNLCHIKAACVGNHDFGDLKVCKPDFVG
jgi:hypothetical protein